MKKIALFLSIVVAAIACDKVEPITPPEVDFANPDVVIPFAGCDEESPVTIEFKANVDWTAELIADETADGEPWISISPKSGKAGEAVINIVATENELEATRAAQVKVTVGVSVLNFDIVQEGIPYLTIEPSEVVFDSEGGSQDVSVVTNVEYATSIPENNWLTCSFNDERGVYVLTALPNEAYAGRSLTITLSNNVEGISETLVVTQKGVANVEYNVFLDNVDKLGTLSNAKIALSGNHLLVYTGSSLHSFNKNTGAYEQAITLPEGIVLGSLTNDDAGNIVFAADATCPDGSIAIFAISSLDEISPSLTPIITYTPSAFYAGIVGNIRVRGNVKADALITATVGTVNYMIYWEIKEGVLQETDSNWSAFAGTAINGPAYGCAAPLTNKKEDGFLFIGYDGRYNLMYTADLTEWKSVYDETANATVDCSGNNYASIATVAHKDKRYAAFQRCTHWWTAAGGATVLIDMTDPANPEHIFDNVSTYYSEKGNYSDVALESADGVLNMYVFDAQWNMLEKVAIAL